METSDSDYFESADEDFSDSETKFHHARNVKAKPDAAVHSITGRLKKQLIFLDAERTQEKNEDDAIDKKQEDMETKSQRNIWDSNDWDDLQTTSTGKPIVKGVPKPDTKEEETMWNDDDNEWNEIETMLKNESKSANKKSGAAAAPKQSAFDEPPERVGCWEEGVNTVNSYMKEFSKKLETDEIWERDVSVDSPSAEGKGSFGNIGDTKKAPATITATTITTTATVATTTTTKHDPGKEEENMWDNDEWEPIEDTKEESPWGSWGNWGISSVISKASNITSQVSQSLTTVLESGIGALDPEEMARINKQEMEKLRETNPEEPHETKPPKLSFDIGNFVQGVTKLVETTGSKVITGGLDTLETIGKKTMEVLQDNDPGLKRKTAFLLIKDEKPILSQVLREAKEKAEQDNKKLEERHLARKANYEMLFDDHQGLVHLEALEMLSKQCDIKLQNRLELSSGKELADIQETMDQVKELCELPDEEDNETADVSEMKEKLELAVSELNVGISYNRLMKLWDEVESWLNNINLNICSEHELHQQAIETLAQLTALSVEQFHKCGELLLVKEHRSTADEADSLVQLTTTLTAFIGITAAKFSEKLNSIASNKNNKEDVNGLITNVFFEAANSSSYIQDAFQLLIPVLQVGAV